MSTITQSGPVPPEHDPVAPGQPDARAPLADPPASVTAPPFVPVVPAPPAVEPALHVPRDTTPTWELEMLVSGAVLYGLFQLPPVVDSAWRALSVRLASEFAQVLGQLGFVYVKASVYALTLTFVAHLASRAYWVALVGVDSVFPGGIRWEATRGYGPITRKLMAGRVPALSRVISRLDNFCSITFAVGFAAVSAMLFTAALLLGFWVLGWGVSRLFFRGSGLPYVVLVGIVVILLPVFGLLADRRIGERLPPDSWPALVIRFVARLNPRLAGLGMLGSLGLTLSTNLGARRVRLTMFGLLLVSVLIAMAQLQERRKGVASTVLPGLPSTLQQQAGQYRHYADQRGGADAYAPVPFIQSDIVQGPYVRLFIPYVPERDEYELSACRRARVAPAASPAVPSAAPTPATRAVGAPSGAAPSPGAGAPGEDEIAVLCLGGMYDVSVDGRRMSGIDYRFYTDAASGLQGVLGYVPTAGLPRGGNVLVVRRPRPDADTPPPPPYVIPFWL
jgi:hypothetical protein